jgi:hypothetical protein
MLHRSQGWNFEAGWFPGEPLFLFKVRILSLGNNQCIDVFSLVILKFRVGLWYVRHSRGNAGVEK